MVDVSKLKNLVMGEERWLFKLDEININCCDRLQNSADSLSSSDSLVVIVAKFDDHKVFQGSSSGENEILALNCVTLLI